MDELEKKNTSTKKTTNKIRRINKSLEHKSENTQGKSIQTSSEKEKAETCELHHTTFNWRIHYFRRLTDAKSVFVIGSPTFTCQITPQQVSEWYLSLNYCPGDTASFKVGIFLKNLKGPGSNEIRVHASLYLMKTRGGIAISCGSIKRNFRIEDPSSIFRRYDHKVNERSCCERNPRSTTCHEWFENIQLEKLMDMRKTILSDTILNLKAEVKVWSIEGSSLTGEEQIDLMNTMSSIPEELPEPIKYWDKRGNADYVIMCEDQDFKVHKGVLSAASPVFASMINSMYPDSVPKSIHTQAMMIRDIEAPIMAIFLEHIYSGTFGSFGVIHMSYDIAWKILKGATDYKLFSVKKLCFQKMCQGLRLNNAGHYAILAEEFKASPKVKSEINKFLRRNWGILQQSGEFRELFKAVPEAFEFVFSVLMD